MKSVTKHSKQGWLNFITAALLFIAVATPKLGFSLDRSELRFKDTNKRVADLNLNRDQILAQYETTGTNTTIKADVVNKLVGENKDNPWALLSLFEQSTYDSDELDFKALRDGYKTAFLKALDASITDEKKREALKKLVEELPSKLIENLLTEDNIDALGLTTVEALTAKQLEEQKKELEAVKADIAKEREAAAKLAEEKKKEDEAKKNEPPKKDNSEELLSIMAKCANDLMGSVGTALKTFQDQQLATLSNFAKDLAADKAAQDKKFQDKLNNIEQGLLARNDRPRQDPRDRMRDEMLRKMMDDDKEDDHKGDRNSNPPTAPNNQTASAPPQRDRSALNNLPTSVPQGQQQQGGGFMPPQSSVDPSIYGLDTGETSVDTTIGNAEITNSRNLLSPIKSGLGMAQKVIDSASTILQPTRSSINRLSSQVGKLRRWAKGLEGQIQLNTQRKEELADMRASIEKNAEKYGIEKLVKAEKKLKMQLARAQSNAPITIGNAPNPAAAQQQVGAQIAQLSRELEEVTALKDENIQNVKLDGRETLGRKERMLTEETAKLQATYEEVAGLYNEADDLLTEQRDTAKEMQYAALSGGQNGMIRTATGYRPIGGSSTGFSGLSSRQQSIQNAGGFQRGTFSGQPVGSASRTNL